MSISEASEYAQGKILNHITCFTSPEVQKIFDSQRSTALKSNIDFYSFDGAAKMVQKIELFNKPLDVEYKLPHELYRELTSDSSLHNTVMLQAIKLSQASAPIPPLLTDVSPAPVYATNAQPRPAYKGLGGRPTTPPHNSTAQYRARSPSAGRPFTPSGTSKQIGNGSSPIGHQSRSYFSGRQNHMNKAKKNNSQPHTQSNPAVPYRNSSPYRNDQGRNSASNRPHYANQGHRSPSQPRGQYGSSH